MSQARPSPPLRVMLLSASPQINLKLLYCLAETNTHVEVLSNREDNLLKYSRLKSAYHFLPWHTLDENTAVFELKALMQKRAIDVILAGDIPASIFLHSCQASLKENEFLTVSSPEVFEAMDDKWVFAERLMKAGIRTPHTVLLAQRSDVNAEHLSSLNFPIIVKPLHGESSHGVVKIESFEKLTTYLDTKGPYKSFPLIAQQFIDGDDIDLSFISKDGVIYAEAVQQWRNLDELVFSTHAEVSRLAHEVVSLYQFSGPGHFDMREDRKTGEIYVIECNPRFWASIPAAMYCGANFAKWACEIARGEPLSAMRAQGEYLLPAFLMKKVLRDPSLWWRLSKQQKRGMLQVLRDPLPQLVQRFRA